MLFLIAVFAVATILAEYGSNRLYVFFTKPMTTLLIIGLPLLLSPADENYRRWIMTGLGFSLAGDILLMWPDSLFLYGLIAFLLAQISYITAFTRNISFRWDWTFLPYLALGIFIYVFLYPGLGKMAVPVLIYLLVIMLMGWTALQRYRGGMVPHLLAVFGAVLFILSDAALAFDRFYQAYDLSRLVVLGTYFPAQVLLALSVKGD